jgi:hypothetical protein
MDTPQVDAAALRAALEPLAGGSADAVLGLATDGGWWAIGLSAPQPGVFAGIPTSRADTGARQRRRLARLGLRTTLLATERDVDTWDDALAVAAACPHGAFAAAVRAVAHQAVPVGAMS